MLPSKPDAPFGRDRKILLERLTQREVEIVKLLCQRRCVGLS
jgi:hypothetical protein